MRRITAVAATTGAVIMTTLALATPAQASTAWTAPKITNVKATGSWWYSGKRLGFQGKLTDLKKDGYTACVAFKWTTKTTVYYDRFWIANSKGSRVDGVGYAKLGNHYTTEGALHLWVKGCRLKTSTGAQTSTSWKQLH